MTQEPFTFRVTVDRPDLGLLVGDRVVVDPGCLHPIVRLRDLPPNYGLILDLTTSGVLAYLTPHRPLAVFAAAVGHEPLHRDSPSPSPGPPPRGHSLHVVR